MATNNPQYEELKKATTPQATEDNPFGLVKGTGETDYKYISERTRKLLQEEAANQVDGVVNKGKAVPGIIDAVSDFSSENYVGGALKILKTAPVAIKGSISTYKGVKGLSASQKSFKLDCEGLSKDEEKLAKAEFAQARFDAYLNGAEHNSDDLKTMANDGLNKLEGHADRVKRAERIVPTSSGPDLSNMKDAGGDW